MKSITCLALALLLGASTAFAEDIIKGTAAPGMTFQTLSNASAMVLVGTIPLQDKTVEVRCDKTLLCRLTLPSGTVHTSRASRTDLPSGKVELRGLLPNGRYGIELDGINAG